jgi:hypothetical protein
MQWIFSGMPPLVRDQLGSASAIQLTAPQSTQAAPNFRFRGTKDHVLRVLRDLDGILKMLVSSLDSSEQSDLTASTTTPLTTSPTRSHNNDPERSGALSSTGESIKSVKPCRFDLNLIHQTKTQNHGVTALVDKKENLGGPRVQALSILSKPSIRPFGVLPPKDVIAPQMVEFTSHPASPRRHLTGMHLRGTSSVKRDIAPTLESLSGKRRRFSIKHYSDPAPSMHCHVCK